MSGDAIRFGDSVIHPMATHQDRRGIEFKHNRLTLQDNLPVGAVAFFNKTSCPPKWEAYTTIGINYIKAAIASIEGTGGSVTHTHTVNCDHYTASTVLDGSTGPLKLGSSGAGSGSAATIVPAFLKYICCRKVVA